MSVFLYLCEGIHAQVTSQGGGGREGGEGRGGGGRGEGGGRGGGGGSQKSAVITS